MENYAMRGYGHNHYMTIIEELEDSYFVRVVKDRGGREDVDTGFMSKEFFAGCLRTGYLTRLDASKPIPMKEKMVANA
jgi:hypothetical protein